MKRLFFLAACLIVSVGIALTQPSGEQSDPKPDPDAPDFKWEVTTHDFGDIPQEIPVKTSFSFTNSGKKALVITRVTKSCGCTTPKWSEEPVLPGKEGNIKVGFNASSPGRFNKSVTIFSNAAQKECRLAIKGNVIAKP